MAVVHMVNNLMSSCRNCMFLLQILALNGLCFSRQICVKYIKSADNYLADSLSRGLIDKFKHLAPASVNEYPDKINSKLWPLSHLWQYDIK